MTNGTRQDNIFHTTIRIQQVIEDEVRQRPHEWFWLLRRWKTTPDEISNSNQIPMEHRDLSAEQSRKIRHWREENLQLADIITSSDNVQISSLGLPTAGE